MPPTATKKKKYAPTVADVKEALGRTWFTITDEETFINIESRDYGDVGNETPGKKDIEEGKRLLTLLRKAFKQSNWVTKFEIVDEWVTVSLRVAPLSKEEKAKVAREKKLNKLRDDLRTVTTEANEATKKEGHRGSFSSFVHDGNYSKKATLKVVFGERYLYLNHLGSRFVFSNEVDADAALKPLVEKFPGLAWTKTIREPTPRRTGNYSPPNNVIEIEGYVEYEAYIRNL